MGFSFLKRLNLAGDAETRISVTGHLIYLLGAPICWRSKVQKGVTLSSNEAEYVAMSEAAKDLFYLFCFKRNEN
jgi:hypothetical protein